MATLYLDKQRKRGRSRVKSQYKCNKCMLTLTATFVSAVLPLICLATPSNTSPNAPDPRNLVRVICSRRICGRPASSASVGQ